MTDNLNEKLDYLYFLSVILYNEIKYHNLLIDEKEKSQKKSKVLEGYQSLSNGSIPIEDRYIYFRLLKINFLKD